MTDDPHRVNIGDLVVLNQETINDIYDGDAFLGVGLVTDVWPVPSTDSTNQVLYSGRTTTKVLFGDQKSEWYNWQLEVVSRGLV